VTFGCPVWHNGIASHEILSDGAAIMKALMAWVLALSGMSELAWVQNTGAQSIPYCADLNRLVALAMTKERFASIAGKPREGNFVETSLSLTGWSDCSLYGATTYTCDSPAHRTAAEAELAQARLLDELKACLGNAWAEAKDRSSSTYVVLHSATRPVSITLSTDQTDKNEHVVHLILFVRRN
jgi:hypothetical protein